MQHKPTAFAADAWRPPCRLVNAGRFAGDQDVPWHVHDDHELILVTEGSCRMSAGRDRWFDGTPGSLHILPAGADQYQVNHTLTRDIFLIFQAPENLFDMTPRTLHVSLDSMCADLFRWISTHYLAAAAAERPLVVDALLYALLMEIVRLEEESSRRRTRNPGLEQLTQLLASHLDRPLSVAEMARQVSLSASHLSALCHHEFGCGPLQLHLRWRLELAAKLLTGKRLSIKEVTAATGFSDVNYFIRQFRQHYTITPGSWAAGHRPLHYRWVK